MNMQQLYNEFIISTVRSSQIWRNYIIKLVHRSRIRYHFSSVSKAPTPMFQLSLFRKSSICPSLINVDAHRVIARLITTAYHVIKTGQPFASFPRAIELQQKNGVDLGTSYHTDEMPWKLLLALRDQVSVSARQSCAEMAVSREESTSCLRVKVGLV